MRVILIAASLLAFAFTAPVDAAPEPVGHCTDATVEFCVVQCIQPPCPAYVCVRAVDERCLGETGDPPGS